MKVKVLVHDKVNARVVSEDDSINVFYTTDNENKDNDCPIEVVYEVVKMFNEGKTLIEIDTYLLDADCTQDAREIMIEGLYPIFNPTKKKVAKLVTVSFMTRVVVDEDASDEEIFEAARPMLKLKAAEEMFENLEEIIDDLECPFDIEFDK